VAGISISPAMGPTDIPWSMGMMMVLCVLRSRMRSSRIDFPILLMKVVDVYSEIKDGGRIAGEENGMTGEDGTGHLWATRPAERLNIFEYFHRWGLI